jgi:hypothetical protein
MITNHTPSFQIAILVLFSNQFFFLVLNLNLFPGFCQNFTSCWLALAIAVALFSRAMYANIHWKFEKDIYAFGIQSFTSFHFEFSSKFGIASSLQSVSRGILAGFINFYKVYLLSHWSYEDTWRPVKKKKMFSISLLFNPWSTSSHNSTGLVFSECCSQSS